MSRPPKAEPPVLISEEDYYRRAGEFRSWLLERHGVYFDKLQADKARKYFRKFVDKWNGGRVDERLYASARNPKTKAPPYRSSHEWKFKRETNDEEDDRVQPGPAAPAEVPRRLPSGGGADAEHEQRQSTAASREQTKREKKEWNKRNREIEDELAPKPEPRSHAAHVEKRRIKHGRRGDESPTYSDAALLSGSVRGGGAADEAYRGVGGAGDARDMFARRREKRERRDAERRAVASERVRELEERERQRMEQFRGQIQLTNRFASSSGGGNSAGAADDKTAPQR